MTLLALSEMTDSQLKQVIWADENDNLSWRAGMELHKRGKYHEFCQEVV